MNDLFLKELPEIDSEFEKSAEMGSVFLPSDSTLWVKEIITNFLQQFPYLQKEQIGVTWNKKDNDKGYAVGHLNVLGGSVPLIVNEFKLSPMDIFMINGESLPLNDYFISKIYQKPEAFKELETGKRRGGYVSLFGSNNALQFSPTQDYGGNSGRTTRDAVKVASVIENLSYIDTDDAMETIAALKEPEVKRAYKKHGHMDLFTKIAERAKKSSKSSVLDDYFRGLDVDRQMVYSDEYGNSFVKQANSRVDKTWTVEVDALDRKDLDPIMANEKLAAKMKEVKSEDKAEYVKDGKYYVALNDESKMNPEVEGFVKIKKASFSMNSLKEGQKGVLAVKSDDLVAYDDFEITKIAKVEPNPQAYCVSRHDDTKNGAIVIEKTGEYTYRDKVANSTIKFEDLEGKEPEIGDFGVFVTKEAATEPFEVTGTVKMAGPGNYEISGEQGFKKVAYYPVNTTDNTFTKHEKNNFGHYVPKNAKFVKLSGQNDKMAELKDFEAQIKVEGLNGFRKVAFYLTNSQDTTWLAEKDQYVLNEGDLVFAEHHDIEKSANLTNFHSSHEVYRDKSGLYGLRGEEFAKYAQTNPIRNLNKNDAKWAALHCGATEKDLKKVASLKMGDSCELEGRMAAPVSLERVEKKLKEKYAEFGDKKLKISKNLTKIAAQFRDKTSVDAILSLNMLRKKNIQEYLAMLPTFQYVLGELAKLLLASRMGMEQTDPDAIKTALDSMTDVVMQLERLQAAATEIK